MAGTVSSEDTEKQRVLALPREAHGLVEKGEVNRRMCAVAQVGQWSEKGLGVGFRSPKGQH